jgi:Ran-binding protein 3
MFANKSSPFLSSSPKPPSTPAARGSTPKSGEAFGSYSNTPTHFGASLNPSHGKVVASTRKKVLGASDSTFGDILASDKGGESECKENKFGNIEEVDSACCLLFSGSCLSEYISLVHTGEEHEKTVHQTRAKLYTMDSRDTYKERGTGLLKVNVRKSDGRGGRLGAKFVPNLVTLISLLMSFATSYASGWGVQVDPER